MPDTARHSPETLVADIDSMARAAYTWVRQQTFEQRFIGLAVSAAEESDLAAGFLAGLRVRLTLADTESLLLAYVYALMSGERVNARKVANELLAKSGGDVTSCSGYLHGLHAAREMLNNANIDAFASLREWPRAHVAFTEH